MELFVVFSGAVPTELEAVGGLGLRRLLVQGNFHAPEVPDDLVSTVLGQSAALVGDDVDVEAGEVAFTCPGLGEVEEVPADPAPARVGVDGRFVLQVRQVALAPSAHVGDQLPVDVCEPGVAFEVRLVETPPFAELRTAELQPFDLAEVDAVPLADESRDSVGIVEGWAAYEKVGQSGWPDSNRRLLRPKRSTLTRLSYTP
jgi:hypothetical protein